MIRYKNLTIIPTYHSNLDFVHEIRTCFYNSPPDRIAVEFPENLEKKILLGVRRLPSISIIIYFDELLGQQLYIPIIPSDSLIEAIRLGREYGLPIEFIDLFVKNYDPVLTPLPDSYALNFLSLTEFYEIVQKELHFEDLAKKQFNETEKTIQTQKDIDTAEKNVLESESSTQIPTGKEAQDWMSNPREIDDLRNNYMASRLSELIQKYPEEKILIVLGMAHWEAIKILLEHNKGNSDLTAFGPEIQAEIYNILQDDLPKVMLETPNTVLQFEIFRKRQKKAMDKISNFSNSEFELIKFDLFKAIKTIIHRSVAQYHREYNEEINLHKLKSLFQYIRNLPMIESKITPHLFEIVLAAKSIVNDDFAWIVWEECKYYPYAVEDPKLESLPFTNKGILLHGKYFKLRRNIPLKIQKIRLPLKPRPKEDQKGDWRAAWNQDRWDLASHIPEDIFEEDYFRHVRQRSMNLLKDHNVKIHEFTSTLMDGIDFRETIRNWPLEHKIYVREERPIRGEVDSVVIIFDRDDDEMERYPHEMMWYAEHEQESDLAFYSTFPGIELVGPGISRIELGGVTSFFPPRGVPNIWTAKFVKKYPMAKAKADRLLMAAILFAQKKILTYVATQKPKPIFYQIARLLDISILYLPLDRFNPISLRALRNLHVLAGKHTREIAHKYIKKRRI
ncbi:hypothetical protein [Candidatus Lokiarchaeum ossiferum]|uniref:hypothetical protein n=1 Tax=Candidatus Lokiarchaeum ossiferum TaxID=2951803 RepID=UPI00352CD5FA